MDHAEEPKDYAWIGNVFVFGVIAWTLVFRAPAKSGAPPETPKKPSEPFPPRVPAPRPAPAPAAVQPPATARVAEAPVVQAPAPVAQAPAPVVPGPVVREPAEVPTAFPAQPAPVPAAASVTAPPAPPAPPTAPVLATPAPASAASPVPKFPSPAAKEAAPYRWVPAAPQRLVVAPVPKKRFDWLQIGITTLVIAVIVACIAEAYLQITSEKLAAAKARPHVAVRVSAIKRLEGEFLAQETVDDYGDAPAINAQLITVTIPEVATAGDFFRRADSGQTDITPANLGFVLPGKPQSYEAPIVAPDPNDFTIDRNLRNGQPVTVVGRVVYQDSRGRTYHTDFCATGTASGPFQDCAQYNFQK